MKVLIGYDGSESSLAAIRDLTFAGLPSTAYATILTVADVWQPPAPLENYRHPENDLDRHIAAAAGRLEAHKNKALGDASERVGQARTLLLSIFPGWRVTTKIVVGSPAWEIVKLANEILPDLVVVGAQGRSALGRLWFGSVSQKVMHESQFSVRIGRAHPSKNRESINILLAVDGSDHSKLLVASMLKRHWPPQSKVRILTCTGIDLSAHDGSYADVVTENERLFIDHFQRHFGEELSHQGLIVDYVLSDEEPKHRILIEAEQWPADLIIVGSKGLNQWGRFLLGSVSSAVASRAHCSVEVIREHQGEDQIKSKEQD